MVRVAKCNQMIMEYDENSCQSKTTKLLNKYLICRSKEEIGTCVLIDPDCRKVLYIKKEEPNKYLCFCNMKNLKIDSYNFSNETKLISHIQSQKFKKQKLLTIDMQSSIAANTSTKDILINLNEFRKCIINKIKIEIVEKLEIETIGFFIESISKINRLNHLHLKIIDPTTLYVIMKEIYILSPKIKITVEGCPKLKYFYLTNIRTKFKNTEFMQIKE